MIKLTSELMALDLKSTQYSESFLFYLKETGINFQEYKKNYETSSLPNNMRFNNDGIELIKGDEWVEFYHTFLSDPLAKSMIEEKLKTDQIIEFNGRFGLNDSNTNNAVSDYRKETTGLFSDLI